MEFPSDFSVREALLQEGIVHITQSIPHSEEVIFPAGDVSKMAKFSQGSLFSQIRRAGVLAGCPWFQFVF